MIVYRDRSTPAKSEDLLRHLYSRLRKLLVHSNSHDEIVEVFVDFGDLESALVDRLSPREDAINDLVLKLRDISVLLGRIVYRSWIGNVAGMGPLLERLAENTERLLSTPMPRDLDLHIPEGYAFYGLVPEMYLESTRQFFRACGPAHAVCIGIRTIGASLSGAVAGTLEELGCRTFSLTLRPRGHPMNRTIAVANELSRAITSKHDAAFLIIDEGPGLSGSSFGSVAEFLSRAGVPDDLIFLFPSWIAPEDSLASELGRMHWRRHRKFCTSFGEVYIDAGVLFGDVPEYMDLSAGQWRSLLFSGKANYPAVHPQHEKRKFLVHREHGAPLLYKFAGYGDRAKSKFQRAQSLEKSGFGPPVVGMHAGFIISQFIPGRPMSPGTAGMRFLKDAAQYLAFIAGRFEGTGPVNLDEALELIRVNAGEALGERCLSLLPKIESLKRTLRLDHSVALDARMFAHEWIDCNGSYKKTDGLDHHDDHFFPGAQDLAWDVAAFSIEFELSSHKEIYLIRCLESFAQTHLTPEKILFYRIFYLAFRAGYCSLAANTLAGSEDGGRFQRLYEHYSQLLERHLRSL